MYKLFMDIIILFFKPTVILKALQNNVSVLAYEFQYQQWREVKEK